MKTYIWRLVLIGMILVGCAPTGIPNDKLYKGCEYHNTEAGNLEPRCGPKHFNYK